jgi:hypothetical protein
MISPSPFLDSVRIAGQKQSPGRWLVATARLAEQTFRIFHHDPFKHFRQETCAAIAKKQSGDMPGE